MAHIDIIKYINLESNQDRKSLIESLLDKFPYPSIRVPGVIYKPEDPSFRKYLKFGIDTYLDGYRYLNGVIGCWIAHSHALENIAKSEGITVILEDDFICEENFFEVALKMIHLFNKKFDVVIFDPWGLGPLEDHKVSEQIYKANGCNYPYYGGTHCLFVNNESIPKILQIKSTSLIKDFDGFLIDNNQIDCFMFYTGLSRVRRMKSDIRGYDDK